MSRPTRQKSRGPKPRQNRNYHCEAIAPLEPRQLLTVDVFGFSSIEVTISGIPDPALDPPITGIPAGFVDIEFEEGFANPFGSAGVTSVNLLSPAENFGGDIVRIEAGPGGDFGKVVYAISRGGGDNPGAINAPGVIYRVNPATGDSDIFFDLNTVIPQIAAAQAGTTAPLTDAANLENPAAGGLAPSTGLVNNYDIAFDVEGYFDGRPSMFVSSVDETDPLKNVIYRIGPDGSFLGAFASFVDDGGTETFVNAPSAILITPTQQQSFLRGLFAGDGVFSDTFRTFFFDANAYTPGQAIDSPILPVGVEDTFFSFGPLTGLTAANPNYFSPVYATFTDFGIPAAPGQGLPGIPGFSGVQGSNGDLLFNPDLEAMDTPINVPDADGGIADEGFIDINNALGFDVSDDGDTDLGFGLVFSDYRRLQDAAFDQFGYFSYNLPLAPTGDGGLPDAGATLTVPPTAPPADDDGEGFEGSLFVSDLHSGLGFNVTVQGQVDTDDDGNPVFGDVNVLVPLTSDGPLSIDLTGFIGLDDPEDNSLIIDYQPNGIDALGGTILRIAPDGQVFPFADGFNVSSLVGPDGFLSSSLSLDFSADGSILYASDNDGIYQFKTTTSLANSDTGSLIGLGDLRSLGVPYEGQDSAVAVIDTGVDANTTGFRGRVAEGRNIAFGGPGNDDLNPSDPGDVVPTGHGTLIASVITQMVPQATIQPVDVFVNRPGLPIPPSPLPGDTISSPTTSFQLFFEGLDFVADNPFVPDPIRPGQLDRVIAANIGFGTQNAPTVLDGGAPDPDGAVFATEGEFFREFPKISLAIKSQLRQFRNVGIAPVAPSGQFSDVDDFASGEFVGESIPALFNEVISVSGSFPSTFDLGPDSTPDDPFQGPVERTRGTHIVFDNGVTLAPELAPFNNDGFAIFVDRISPAVNRTTTTDFVAPVINIPVFNLRTAEAANDELLLREGGTSLSSALVTGSIAIVASAIDYWSELNVEGSTVDPYLTQPVGVNSLNFGVGELRDLSVYANPDSIYGILQWTAVPAPDDPRFQSAFEAPLLIGLGTPRDFARVDVGNAIAAIEGQIALQFLIERDMLSVIDTNNNALITAEELQSFVDSAESRGLAEEGAMARLLGGNDRPFDEPTPTGTLETPDDPDVLQRRFNFFDFVADGQLNGVVSITQYETLVHNLLPLPDQFVVTDRQRASANGFLVDPDANRPWTDLHRLLPQYVFAPIPPSIIEQFRNVDPRRFQFGLGEGEDPLAINPDFDLFSTDPRVMQARQRALATQIQDTDPVDQTGSDRVADNDPAANTNDPGAPVDTATNPDNSGGSSNNGGTSPLSPLVSDDSGVDPTSPLGQLLGLMSGPPTSSTTDPGSPVTAGEVGDPVALDNSGSGSNQSTSEGSSNGNGTAGSPSASSQQVPQDTTDPQFTRNELYRQVLERRESRRDVAEDIIRNKPVYNVENPSVVDEFLEDTYDTIKDTVEDIGDFFGL